MTQTNYLLITQPQYHGIVGVRRHLLKPSHPTAFLKGQLEKVAQSCVQSGFEYLYGWRFYNRSE